MGTFSLDGFTKFLGAVARNVHPTEHAALEKAGQIIEDEAKSFIGHRQPAAGNFGAWDPLADSTIEGYKGMPGKAELGFTPPDYDPLLRSGELWDSIKHTVSGREVEVGSDSPVAEWQELGTNNGIPARSFLARAAFVKTDEVGKMVGRTFVDLLMGRSKVGIGVHAGTKDVTPE